MAKAQYFSVASVNVNGIRAAFRKGMSEWLTQAAPDVLLLQEVRAEEEIACDLLGEEYDTIVEPSKIKGRSGVAVAVRSSSSAVALAPGGAIQRGLAEDEPPVDSGRWLEVDLLVQGETPMTVVSAYFHAGQAGHPRQDAKMMHLAAIDRRMESLLERENALVSGDFNIVRGPLDIKNWKSNHNKTSGVLDEEITYLNDWTKSGWSDVVRALAGERQGPYSWWSMRGKAFDNDAGWRIDYHFSTPRLSRAALSCRVDRAASWDTRFSDHAPVVVDFAL